MKTIGIIAGNGRFPIHVVEKARQQGYRTVVCGIMKEADPILETLCDSFQWIKIGQLAKLKNFFLKEEARQAVMAGKIEKVRLFQENVSPDLDMIKVLFKTRDFKDDSLLGAIAHYLKTNGVELLDSTVFSKNDMPGEGVLGTARPSPEILEDVAFGFQMAKAIAGLDIGQTVVVKKKAVLAVEAIEGTDLAVRRAAQLGREGIVAVKVSKPNQDMRFDVPVIGTQTMRVLIEVKAGALAFEAGKTLFIDREEVVREADRHRIVLMGFSG